MCVVTDVAIDSLHFENDKCIRLQDKNKESHESFDFVIDASGAHSKFREFAIKNTASQTLQYGSLWSKVDLEHDVNFDCHRMQLYCDKYNVGIGMMPIGKLALKDKPQMALFWNMKWQDYPRWRAGNLDEWKDYSVEKWPATKAFLNKITHHDQMYLAKFIYHTLPKPYGCNLAFVGDAAHATNPQLGQGINMSLVDAVVLSWSFQQHSDMASALKLYAQTRRNHVNFYQTMARILTPFYQSDNYMAIHCRDWLYEPLSKIAAVKCVTANIISGQVKQPLKSCI
ncbi:MAG: FAD-dependent monooxygenase [Moraxellaceae bacterium]|nr:MAG: FAD-dependent monooxygenase [Moraxellaceae bacterium]